MPSPCRLRVFSGLCLPRPVPLGTGGRSSLPFPDRRREPFCSRPSTRSIANPSATTGVVQQVTSLPFKLYGIRISEGSGLGSAIIADDTGKQSSFAVGEEIMPGITLKAVAFDHVTISRSGADETLYIDQSGGAPVAAPAAPPVTPAGSGSVFAPPPAPPAAGSEQLAPQAILNGVSFYAAHREWRRDRRRAQCPGLERYFSRAPGSVPATSSRNITACRSVHPRTCFRSRTPSSPVRASRSWSSAARRPSPLPSSFRTTNEVEEF